MAPFGWERSLAKSIASLLSSVGAVTGVAETWQNVLRRHNDGHQEYRKREAVSLLNKPLICVNTKCNGTNPGRLRLSRRHIRTASDREHAVAGNLGWRIVLDTTIINIVVSNQLATISGPYLHVS